MGIGDMVNQAKDALGGDAAVDEKIEQAAEAITDKTPEQVDDLVNKAADAAKDVI